MPDSPRPALVPILVVVAALVVLAVLVFLVGRDPIVESVLPTVADPGDEIVVTGRHFGASAASLAIGSTTLPASSVTSWTDTEIRFTLPRNVDSGLLYVVADRGRSSGVLLRLDSSTPRVAQDDSIGVPQVDEVSSDAVGVGTILTISGTHFGRARRDAQVLFPMAGGTPCTECGAEYAYASWSDTRIEVRVPAGVVSGFLVVHTPWGDSAPIRITVEHAAGEIEWIEPIELSIRYGARLDNVTLVGGGSSVQPGQRDIALQLPGVVESPAQRSLRYLDDQPDTFRFRSVSVGFNADVIRTLIVKRYSASSKVDASRISAAYETESGFYEYFTRSIPGIPSDSEDIVKVADRLRRGKGSPYRIAEAIYAYVLDTLTFALGTADRSVEGALASGYGDDLSYAELFVTLARAAGVPARYVGGVLVTDAGDAYAHFWAEFFVTGIGWIPVDPALGDGAFPASFPVPDDPKSFYFANLDNHRVAFHNGYDDRSPSYLDGLATAPDDPYTVQKVYAEAGPLVSDYRLVWYAPRLIGEFPAD